MSRRLIACLFIMSIFAAACSGVPCNAQEEQDALTFYGQGQPLGPVTPVYLRHYQPMYLLDLVRRVKRGELDRQKVEPIVGHNAFEALLAKDLDALYQTLTAPPPDPGTGDPQPTRWSLILNNAGTDPPPAADAPTALDFHRIQPGATARRVLYLTVPADGVAEASLPDGSPFRIRAMRTYDGWVQGPTVNETGSRDTVQWTQRNRAQSRTRAPWVLPVNAGDDVDVELDLPVDSSALPGDDISDTITIADTLSDQWQANVLVKGTVAPCVECDVKLTIDAPQPSFDVVSEPAYNPLIPRTVLVPLFASNAVPPVAVQGTIQSESLPPGVSLSASNFTVQPGQTADISFVISIDRQSLAWLAQEVQQNFSIRVNYHSAVSGTRSEVIDFDFTVHRGSQSWFAKGSGLGVNCRESVVVYSDGETTRDGICEDFNLYHAKVFADGFLAQTKIINDAYFLGWENQDFRWFSTNIPAFKTNYLYVRGQPLLMLWTITIYP